MPAKRANPLRNRLDDDLNDAEMDQLKEQFVIYLAENDIELSPRPIVDGCGDCRTPFADEIMALVDAAVLRDEAEFPDARIRVELALGRAGADRVAMVVGTFEMISTPTKRAKTRIVRATAGSSITVLPPGRGRGCGDSSPRRGG